MKRNLLAGVLTATIAAPTCWAGSYLGKTFPDFTATDAITGEFVALSDLRGKAVLVDFWATWCGPCHVEMPEFVRFGNDMADESVAVRFLSIDDPRFLPEVEHFLASYGITGPTYFSGTGDQLIRDIHPRWQYGLPTTLMIDRDMKIRDVWEGAVSYDFLMAKVERMRGILAEDSDSADTTDSLSTGF